MSEGERLSYVLIQLVNAQKSCYGENPIQYMISKTNQLGSIYSNNRCTETLLICLDIPKLINFSLQLVLLFLLLDSFS